MPPTPSSAAKPVREGRLAGAGLRPSSKAITSTTKPSSRPRPISQIPQSLLSDPHLEKDISALPSNYSFELHKTIHRIRQARASRVALQLPEGLLLYATTLSDIILSHTQATDTVILGDVTYGACCVDDLSAKALKCDFLVHYGHSCLVPVSQTAIPCLYVFVHIAFDPTHLKTCLLNNFTRQTNLALVATIQFVDTAHQIRDEIKAHFASIIVPQKRPLSPGELLGCTSPAIAGVDAVVYIGDGRFHLESCMIANPHLQFFRYDPYAKVLTEERYAHREMQSIRLSAVEAAKSADRFGVILGTLGRQGSTNILERILNAMKKANKRYFVLLLSEITPSKIARFEETGVQAWVQIACPRLSIDWGNGFAKPLLTSYEAFVALGVTEWREKYPMDYYAKDGGVWTNYWKEGGDQERLRKEQRRKERERKRALAKTNTVPVST